MENKELINKENEIIKEDIIVSNKKTNKIKKKFIQYLWISLGVIILDLGFFFFLDPAHIVAGGTMGLSIIFVPIFQSIGVKWMTSSIFLYIIDGATLLLGLIFLGKDFFVKTVYASLLSPTVILVFEKLFDPNYFLSQMTDYPSLKLIVAALLGCFLTGVGVGIALKYDGSTGGMDVVQQILSKYFKMPLSFAMYLTDWLVVLFAGFATNDGFTWNYQLINVVLGSGGVFIQAYITDFICLNSRSRRTVYAITDNPEPIKELIYRELDRGVTYSNVVGAYTNQTRTMVICTMDKREAYKIIQMITEIDPTAFTFVTSCKEVRGEYDNRGII